MEAHVSSAFESPDKVVRVAAIVPVHNRRETTLQCLRSLSKIDRTGIDFRVFVVDDGSTDGTDEAIRRAFPEVDVIIGNGSLHYAGGTNLGINAARSWNPNFYLLMNDDAVFHDQFLSRLVATARAIPRSVVGALLLLWDKPHEVFQVGQEWKTLRGGWTFPEDMTAFNVGTEPFDVECLVGNCTLVPGDAVEECGVMDAEKFPHGWGDAQYFMRLRKAGWRLVVDPRAYVWCEPNTYPEPLHSRTVRDALRVLFQNRKHPANLQRQFIARWESAPNRLSALGAFGSFTISLVGKAVTHAFGKGSASAAAQDSKK